MFKGNNWCFMIASNMLTLVCVRTSLLLQRSTVAIEILSSVDATFVFFIVQARGHRWLSKWVSGGRRRGAGHLLGSSLLSETGVFIGATVGRLQSHRTTVLVLHLKARPRHRAPTPNTESTNGNEPLRGTSPIFDHNLHDHKPGVRERLSDPSTTKNRCCRKAETKYSALTFKTSAMRKICVVPKLCLPKR